VREAVPQKSGTVSWLES